MANKSFKVWRAGPHDVDLARLAVAEVHGRSPVAAAAIRSFLGDPFCYLMLAVDKKRVLGSLNGYSLRRPHDIRPQFLLYEIDVRPESRRKGVGHALMSAYAQEARAAGASEIWVISNESNRAALALYRKSGYSRHHHDDVVFQLIIEDCSAQRIRML